MKNIERAKKIKILITDVDGVLTDGKLQFFNPAGLDPASVEIKNFYSLDGMGLMALKLCGVKTGIITGGSLSATGVFSKITAMDYVYHGFLAKKPALEHLANLTGFSYEEMAFVGDDVIDLPILKRVGLACVVPNAAQDMLNYAHYKTTNAGGYGAIREVAELILRAQGKWQHFLDLIEEGDLYGGATGQPQQIFSRKDIEK
ncbi:3-deoxy-D-manno-octulosonate 8-phosphate phosphatase (KDO 8-P phosphatase) [Elusimicrobium simillimum]|uniref:KdsC family phosphatase n=1 Tax=Elusimicrobium simillimum TaxID=3143438 RepID=UPI003C6F9513